MTNIPIGQILGVLGSISAAAIFVWKIGISLLNRYEKASEKKIDYAHKKSEQLEVQKVGLQKELEAQKQRYVQKLIDAIREEMSKVATKVDKLAVQFARVDEKLNFNAKMGEANIKKIQCFVDSTDKRFQTVERQLDSYRTEIKEMGKDLLLIKDVANKVRKQDRNSGTKT